MTKTNIKIAPSSVINYGGLDCIVLDVEQDKILVLAKESIGNMPFDEGNSNNFPKGTLCKYLNGEFIKKLKANGADTSALIPTRSDIECQTLDLISRIKLLDEDDREEIAEEFKAIMEDIFGLEE